MRGASPPQMDAQMFSGVARGKAAQGSCAESPWSLATTPGWGRLLKDGLGRPPASRQRIAGLSPSPACTPRSPGLFGNPGWVSWMAGAGHAHRQQVGSSVRERSWCCVRSDSALSWRAPGAQPLFIPKLAGAEQEDGCDLPCGLRGGSRCLGFAPSPGFARGGCWGPVPHGGHSSGGRGQGGMEAARGGVCTGVSTPGLVRRLVEEGQAVLFLKSSHWLGEAAKGRLTGLVWGRGASARANAPASLLAPRAAPRPALPAAL